MFVLAKCVELGAPLPDKFIQQMKQSNFYISKSFKCAAYLRSRTYTPTLKPNPSLFTHSILLQPPCILSKSRKTFLCMSQARTPHLVTPSQSHPISTICRADRPTPPMHTNIIIYSKHQERFIVFTF